MGEEKESELGRGWYLGGWGAGGLGSFPLEGEHPRPLFLLHIALGGRHMRSCLCGICSLMEEAGIQQSIESMTPGSSGKLPLYEPAKVQAEPWGQNHLPVTAGCRPVASEITFYALSSCLLN